VGLQRAQGTSRGDVSTVWRNIPGFLYLNGDVVEEVRQLSGVGGKGTVDELGFQVLYDRIAEVLFPWCSTLTSRARYFYFSLAVLDIALHEAIDDADVDPNRDPAELAREAERRRVALMRAVKRIERALALSLVAKHATEERGIFGSIRCRRWFREDADVANRGKILSADARYPNAIYRGSCRALNMFGPKDSSTTGLLRARLAGVRIFDIDWHTHSRMALAIVQRLDEFWHDVEEEDVTFAKARVKIDRLHTVLCYICYQVLASVICDKLGQCDTRLPHAIQKSSREIRTSQYPRDPTIDPLPFENGGSRRTENH
jgi:hypothetical protein